MTSLVSASVPARSSQHRSPPNALTVDVEDYFHVAALADAVSPDQWASMPARVDGNTRRLIDLFDEEGVRATFFVLGSNKAVNWIADPPTIFDNMLVRG